MIKAMSVGSDGRQNIVLGLSHENLRRLKDKQPIIVDTKELGMAKGPRIIVCAGETEDAIRLEFESLGVHMDAAKRGFLWDRK